MSPLDKPAVPLSALPELATISEVAAVLRCSTAWVYGKIGQGKLKAAKIAGTYRIKPADLAAFIESCAITSQETKAFPSISTRTAPTAPSKDVAEAAVKLALQTAYGLREKTRVRRLEERKNQRVIGAEPTPKKRK